MKSLELILSYFFFGRRTITTYNSKSTDIPKIDWHYIVYWLHLTVQLTLTYTVSHCTLLDISTDQHYNPLNAKRSVFMLTSRGNKIRNFTFLILKAFVDKWKKKTKTLMFGVKGLPKVVIPTFCFIYILIRNEIKLWLIGLLRMVFLSLRQFWRNYFFVSGKNVFLQSNFVNKLSVLSPHAVSLD